ncbi:MAG: hypothetical protein EOP49_04115 [Sphingobacteriales bacterium]|nr:MAG: hypothetical protein EOP49_04115 [Sphingobacteriales bacterium]
MRFILGVCVLLLTAGFTFPFMVSLRYEEKIKEKLPDWIAQSSGGLYLATIGDLDINMFSKTLELKNIVLKPDLLKIRNLPADSVPPTIYNIRIPSCRVTGIRWADLLAGRDVSCKSFLISDPEIDICKTGAAPKQRGERTSKTSFRAGTIKTLRPVFRFTDCNGRDTSFIHLKGRLIVLHDWVYTAESQADSSRWFFARKGELEIDSLILKKKDELYALKTGRIAFKSGNNSFSVRNLALLPALSRDAYYRRIGRQDELFTVKIPELRLNGLDWKALSSEGALYCGQMELLKPYMHIYLSRLLPPDTSLKKGKFPNQLLRQMKIPFSIKEVRIADGDFEYTEYTDKSGKEGTVTINGIQANITGLSNRQSDIAVHPHCTGRLSGKLMKTANLSMQLDLGMSDSRGSFSLVAELGTMEGTRLNDVLNPLALVELKSLDHKKLMYSIAGDETKARYTMSWLYNDLKVKILGREADGSLSGKGVMSFMVNHALVYSDNPEPGAAIRQVKGSMVPEPRKSFFNLIWAGVRQGALLTAGRNSGISAMVESKH